MKQEVWVLMAAISTPAWCAAFAPPVGGGLLRTVPPQHGPQPGGARRGCGVAVALADYYRELGVAPKAASAEIRAEYLKLAKQLHPDVSKDPADVARFKRINEAYTVLSDDERRYIYDQDIKLNSFRKSQQQSPQTFTRRPKRTQAQENAPASPLVIAGTGLLMVSLFKAIFDWGPAVLRVIKELAIAPSSFVAP